MSIPKHERAPSRLDAQHMARKISMEITTELARTFGYSKAKFEKRIETMTKYLPPGPDREQAAAQIREQEQDFNLWLIEQERRRMHDLSREIPLHLRAANSIWPSCQMELDARRLELDKAVAACWKLQDELQYVAETIPADFNKYTGIVLEIDKLVAYIKNLRKSDAKRSHCKSETVNINTLGQPLFVVSAANFANVNSNGNANCNNASNANGVRPVVGPLDFTTAHDG